MRADSPREPLATMLILFYALLASPLECFQTIGNSDHIHICMPFSKLQVTAARPRRFCMDNIRPSQYLSSRTLPPRGPRFTPSHRESSMSPRTVACPGRMEQRTKRALSRTAGTSARRSVQIRGCCLWLPVDFRICVRRQEAGLVSPMDSALSSHPLGVSSLHSQGP
ncbi:uncharacterized protein B0T15DRAFT_135964 [Chaetomium strumarium]|uniref:Secreted protein n=1 Tax=Chaetomium strumarium TaxID=1170767 RepID=A0AAJ0M575_9PEZI|nr:hypothetical protein B0T15DRAFT_135964 [Chaetomium strumarium]